MVEFPSNVHIPILISYTIGLHGMQIKRPYSYVAFNI
jgi:hypothetical protein